VISVVNSARELIRPFEPKFHIKKDDIKFMPLGLLLTCLVPVVFVFRACIPTTHDALRTTHCVFQDEERLNNRIQPNDGRARNQTL
jgi:hypothetical protein